MSGGGELAGNKTNVRGMNIGSNMLLFNNNNKSNNNNNNINNHNNTQNLSNANNGVYSRT